MFILNHASAPQPRYQAIPAGRFSMRRLTSWQYALLALCQAPVTLAELAEATRAPMPELSEALAYLCAHALVRRW
jgi:DNA-binding transcriptional regulator GbsR (MarR family)